jgi:hypothetical protein
MVVWGIFRDPAFFPATPATRVPLPEGRKVTFIGAAELMVFGLIDDGTLVLFPEDITTRYIALPSIVPPNDKASCSTDGAGGGLENQSNSERIKTETHS